MRVPEKRQYLDLSKITYQGISEIQQHFTDCTWAKNEKRIRTRIAYTSGDVELAKTFIFHPYALDVGIRALKKGCNLVADTSMAVGDIKSHLPKDYAGQLTSLVYDKSVAEESKRIGSAKPAVAMAKAQDAFNNGIVVIGSESSALFELIDLIEEGTAQPALIVGVPVGFAGAAEAKQELAKMSIPFITNPDNRGGSCIASSIVNGLLYITFHS